MHELSICTALLRQVARLAIQEGAQQVSSISLRIGRLAGVEPELLRQAFRYARLGTVAANAELSIEATEVQLRCESCGAVTEARQNVFRCRQCHGTRTVVIGGDELLLVDMRITTEQPDC